MNISCTINTGTINRWLITIFSILTGLYSTDSYSMEKFKLLVHDKTELIFSDRSSDHESTPDNLPDDSPDNSYVDIESGRFIIDGDSRRPYIQGLSHSIKQLLIKRSGELDKKSEVSQNYENSLHLIAQNLELFSSSMGAWIEQNLTINKKHIALLKEQQQEDAQALKDTNKRFIIGLTVSGLFSLASLTISMYQIHQA
jgi:hypothetical protein